MPIQRLTSVSLNSFLRLLFLGLLTTSGYSQDLPRFAAHPQDTYAKDGSMFTLECDFTDSGVYNITIQWTVNTTQLLTVPSSDNKYMYAANGRSLVVSHFDDSMSGQYACLISNGEWVLRSASADVQRKFLTPLYDNEASIEIHEVTMEQNSDVIIKLNPNYLANPMNELSYEWKALKPNSGDQTDSNDYTLSGDDSLANMLDGFVWTRNGTLFIPQVSVSHYYQCEISLDGFSPVYYRVHVMLEGSQSSVNSKSIVIPPVDMIANDGENVYLSCIPGGVSYNDLIVSIAWSCPNSSLIITQKRTEVEISNVAEKNEGLCSCEVDGSVSSSTLVIRDPPVFTELLPSSVPVTYGESRTLTCSVTGDDVLVSWYHNGEWVSSNEPDLTISNAALSDGGAYQCYAVNPAATIVNSTLVTIETFPPTFLPNGTLQDQVAFEGLNVTLFCAATGAPQPSYRWFINDIDTTDLNLLNLNNFILDSSVPGILTVTRLVDKLSGNYTCMAESKLGDVFIGSKNSSAKVIVTAPTELTSSNPKSINSHTGDPFHLNCTVTHDSETSVELTWTKNGQEIADTTLLTQIGSASVRLNITNASLSHNGDYQCVVRTTYDEDPSLPVPTITSAATEVTVTVAPVMPTVSSARASGPGTLLMSWTYNGFVNNLAEYQIETREVNSEEWVYWGSFAKSSVTNQNVTGLKPNTLYYIRVAVIRNIENQPIVYSSEYGPVRTGEDAPSGPPSRINAFTNTTTDLYLEWQAPSSSQANGVLTDYTIRYWYANDTSGNDRSRNTTMDVWEVRVESNATTYMLTKLIPNSVYWVQIAAHTAVGMGPFSDAVETSTTPTIEGVDTNTGEVYEKVWFIFLCAGIVLLMIVVLATVIGVVRWKSKDKGTIYTVRGNMYSYELDGCVSMTEDVVADYEKRKERLPPVGFAESYDGGSQYDTQIDHPSFGRTESFKGSIRGSLRGSFRGSFRGLHPPPEYINPPSFEETLKKRLAHNRSASTTLLERVEHGNFRGSGWSVGHDPKSGLFIPPNSHHRLHDPEVDSMVDKPVFPDAGEETSAESDLSTGFHSQSVTNVESFAQFV